MSLDLNCTLFIVCTPALELNNHGNWEHTASFNKKSNHNLFNSIIFYNQFLSSPEKFAKSELEYLFPRQPNYAATQSVDMSEHVVSALAAHTKQLPGLCMLNRVRSGNFRKGKKR